MAPEWKPHVYAVMCCIMCQSILGYASPKSPYADDTLRFEPPWKKSLDVLTKHVAPQRYEPNWDSLDARPLPAWFDDVKFGIMLHWGVYSVPSYMDCTIKCPTQEEWFWHCWRTEKAKSCVEFMERNYRPGFTYADFAKSFTAELYNPNDWADIFEASGAKYIVLTAKHHEGFTLWPSKVSFNWNAMDVGPKRDLVGELATAIKNRTDIHFGLYHSLYEWYNPEFLEDQKNKFQTQTFVSSKVTPALYELINNYKPDLLWSDGDWSAPDTYWNSTEFLAWLYNDSPVKDSIIVNDRWGSGCACKHGGYWNCHDRYNPKTLQKHKWENVMFIDRHSCGFRRNAPLADYRDMDELTQMMAETISCGGNMLLNVGPTADGRIVPIIEERLRQMGDWLKVNGRAIYGSKPWIPHQNDTVTPGVWYISKKAFWKGSTNIIVYAIVLDWPKGDTLSLGAPSTDPSTTVSLVGYPEPFTWKKRPGGGIYIDIPPIPSDKLPCQWAWLFKLDHLVW